MKLQALDPIPVTNMFYWCDFVGKGLLYFFKCVDIIDRGGIPAWTAVFKSAPYRAGVKVKG